MFKKRQKAGGWWSRNKRGQEYNGTDSADTGSEENCPEQGTSGVTAAGGASFCPEEAERKSAAGGKAVEAEARADMPGTGEPHAAGTMEAGTRIGETEKRAGETASGPAYNMPEEMRKPATGDDMVMQARTLAGRGDYRESLSVLQKVREVRELMYGPDSLETAIVFDEMASVSERLGEPKQAEKLCEEALRTYERLLGEEHPDTAAGYNNLAGIYTAQQRYEEAVELYRKALEIYQRTLGETDRNTAAVYNNLAGVHMEQGGYEQAERMLRKTLSLREKMKDADQM